MKIRTSDLTGRALSWAVAKAQNELTEDGVWIDLSQGAELIALLKMSITPWGHNLELWKADSHLNNDGFRTGFGSTLMMAVSRCAVACHFGQFVDVPDAFVNEEAIEKSKHADYVVDAALARQWYDTWMIGDVRALGIRPDLSNKEMIDVLDEIFTNLDARQGVNDKVIEKVANEMFPFLFLNATARWQGKHDHDDPCVIPVIINMNDGEIHFNGKDNEELAEQNAKDMSIFFEKYDENGGVSLIAISSATFEHLYKNDDQALAIMTGLRTELGEEGITAIRADMDSELNISSEPSM